MSSAQQKKKQKTKGKAHGATSTSALDWSQTDNAPFWLELKKNIDNVVASYPDLPKQAPLGIGEGGASHAFKKTDAIAALSGPGRSYACSANIWFLRMNSAPNPAPITKTAIKIMRERLFHEGPTPLEIQCGLLAEDVDRVDDIVKNGELILLSPEEVVMAFFEEFKNKKNNDGWDSAARTTQMTIHLLDSESDFWRKASNAREKIADDHDALSKTALGRIYEIIFFKAQWEKTHNMKATPKALAKAYTETIQVAGSAEKVTESVCDMAITIHSRALSVSGVKEVLKDQDEFGQHSVFNSINKMQLVIEKARTPELITWAFRMIAALNKAGVLPHDSEALSQRALQGRTRNSNGYGTIDLLCFKHKLVKYVIGKWVHNALLEENAVKDMEDITGDPYAWFRKYGWPNRTDLPDQTWRGGCRAVCCYASS